MSDFDYRSNGFYVKWAKPGSSVIVNIVDRADIDDDRDERLDEALLWQFVDELSDLKRTIENRQNLG